MRCDASCLGAGGGPLATAARCRQQKQRRRPGTTSSSSSASSSCRRLAQGLSAAAPRGRRWLNPDRSWRRKGPHRHSQSVRRWIEADDLAPSSPSHSQQDRFLLLSYNILGVNNASCHGDLYEDIPFEFMRWNSRKDLICQEICRWNADLVCLQEVDRYYDILSSIKKKGYTGSYKRRTGEAKDGCAIFWKEKRFRLLEADTIEFSAFGLRDNVAQVFVFEVCQGHSRRVVVCNIHVLFNPKRGDIKLGQVRMLLSRAHVLSEKWGGIPVVLAGDFNSTPDSAMYEFLSTSELNITAHDKRYISGQDRLQFSLYALPRLLKCSWTSEELKNASGNPKCTLLKHPLELHSSYASVKGNVQTRCPYGEPVATTYHLKFVGTVDYLWYSTGLVPTRVLDTLPMATLKATGGLPSKEIGSDHLALVSEFMFAECREKHPQNPTAIPVMEEREDNLIQS